MSEAPQRNGVFYEKVCGHKGSTAKLTILDTISKMSDDKTNGPEHFDKWFHLLDHLFLRLQRLLTSGGKWNNMKQQFSEG